MGLPTGITGPAYQTIDKALSTGARGYTQKETDYSSISDAFMKKASLDAQIGGMMMDNQMQRAQLMGDLEMGKANLYMQSAQLAQQDAHFQQQRKDAKDADKMSPFEQITGVLAGAAAPAAAGFAIGGPVGAVVGGVAGGAMTLGAGNSRRAQSNIIGNIGTISNAAVAMKGVSNAGKAKDANAELIKSVGSVAGIFRTASPDSEAFQGAQAQLDNYISTYQQKALDAGMPMDQVYKNGAAIRKEAMQGFDPSDKQMLASRKMQSIVTDAQADEAFMDPKHKDHRSAVKRVQAQYVNSFAEGFGGKVPTALQVQSFVAGIDEGVANQFYSGGGGANKARSVSDMGSSGGMGNTSSAKGPDMMTTGQSGGTTIQNQTVPVDNGLNVPNMIIPAAGSGVMAPSPAQAWGVDMDNGPEKMVADASANFNQAAAKDPTLVDKALNKPSAFEPEEAGLKEKAFNVADRILGFGSETGKPKLITGFGNEADRLKTEREGRNAIGARTAEAKQQRMEGGTGNLIEPQITSQDAESQEREKVFKTATDTKQIINSFDLKGRYSTKAEADAMASSVTATVGMNRLRTKLNDPTIREALENMTPTQRQKFQNYLQGLGADAMKGSSKGVAGSALGASVQTNWSEFERSINVANQGRGEKSNLSDEQIKALSEINSMMTPVSRTIAMGFNTGTLTQADVDWVPNSLINMFDPNTDTATSGFNAIHNITWDSFISKYDIYQTSDQKQAIKNSGKAQKKANDEFTLY